MTTPPEPPAGLAARGEALWRSVVEKYRLDPAEIVLLHELARTADELDRLTGALAESEPLVCGAVASCRRLTR